MGHLTRTFDWQTTPLGSPDTWPLSLRTTLGIVLHSAFPMFLFWGKELICFYNDAYRPSLGISGKHPALGKCAQAVWPEIWAFIGPLIEQVMTTGEPAWFEDQLLPIYRNGQLDDVYWTFSYSPAYGDDGQIGGVLVTCTETTERVRTLHKLQTSERRFQNLVQEASVGIIILSGENMVVDEVNDAYAQLIDRKRHELTGKPLFTVIPETEAVFRPIIDRVRTSGEPLYLYGQPYTVYVNGAEKEGFLNLIYQPYREQDGNITGVMVLCQDVTGQKKAEQSLKESEQRFQSAVAAVQGVLWTNNAVGEMEGEQPGWTALTGQTYEEYQGFGWSKVVHPDDVQPTIDAWAIAVREQKPFIFEHRLRLKDGTWGIFSIRAMPLFDAHHSVKEWVGVHTNLTEQRRAEAALRESEARFRNLIDVAPIATAIFRGPEHIIELANDAHLELWGRRADEVLNKPLFTALPEASGQGFEEILAQVLTTGEPFFANELHAPLVRNGKLETVYFNFVYQALREADGTITGIIVVANDITEQVNARKKVEESEAQIRSLVESAPFPIAAYTGREMRIQLANQSILDIWGKGNDVIGQRYADILPELENQEIFDQLDGVYMTGIPFHAKNQRVDLVVNGQLTPYFFNYSFTPLYDASGKVYGVMNTAADITDLALAKQQVEETGATLRDAIELAELGTWQIDLKTRILDYSERLRGWFGIGKDEIITPERAYQPVRAEDRPRVQAAIAHAIAPGSDGIYDIEYTLNPDETGRERVLHIQGRAFVNDQGETYKLSGTAQDVTEQRRLQQELERQVQERTEELEATNEELLASSEELTATNEELTESNQLLVRSNENLQRFAYVASHDLQEPLRKIQQFGDLLKTAYGDRLGNELGYLERMQSAASRMSVLIRDLLNFSRISTQRETGEPVSLNQIVQTVLSDLDLVIEETSAQVFVEPLPTVIGDALQLGQLFSNLLSNSLKFRQPGVPPVIRVQADLIGADQLPTGVKPIRTALTYQRIQVVDNGIGFDEKYLDRIFQVFQRLHGRSEFVGTGIGLAICEKVVVNHGGAITGTSKPGQGATFSVYLPT
ncbi:PAS domain-containing protein [Spirosoma radiotolerans]